MNRMILAILAAVSLGGCSLNMRLVDSGAASPAREEIHLELRADAQLNRYDKSSHALMLCLYQLKDPAGFRQLAQDRDGVPKLLECGRFDPSVVNARLIVVQPGQSVSHSCDRDEGARYLGLATGYYTQGKKKVTELFPLPGRSGAAVPGQFRLELGPQEITDARVE